MLWEVDMVEPSEATDIGPKRRWPWTLLVSVVLVCVSAFLLFASYATWRRGHEERAPRFPPVTLEIVYSGESKSAGLNATAYGGTTHYTFHNTWHFPVTLAFPPICAYTYGDNFQDCPFPDENEHLPEFAKERREIVIPAGQSVSFTSEFNITCPQGVPSSNWAFVFGPPRSPCKHPVLGTVYGSVVKYIESPQNGAKKK
jgi:hypothetical protein